MSSPYRSLSQRSLLNGEIAVSIHAREAPSGPMASVILGPDDHRLTSDDADWFREVAACCLSAANGLDAARANADGGES
jgi:hypothetical protein